MARDVFTPLRARRATPSTKSLAGMLGMRDAVEPALSHAKKAKLIRNMHPIGVHWYGRPGFDQIGAQLGAGGARTAQGVYNFTKKSGTEHRIVIVGGKFYTYNPGTDTFTESLTAGNLSGASVTLSATARVYFATFNDKVVISDGVNTPWAWDGTANAGITKLTNAPVAFGRPTVYYAKLFFIKNTERSTIVWSEELAENTGYEAGGFANAWTLGQTEQEALYAIHGTNEALYYWRARSTGSILGAVDSEFSTTGTHESVSGSIGTTSPDTVTQVGRSIFFLDADGRPQLLQTGGGVLGDSDSAAVRASDERRPIWDDAAVTIEGIDRAQLASAQGIYRDDIPCVLFAVQLTNRSARDRCLAYSVTGQFLGVWQGFSAQAIGVLKDSASKPRMVHVEDDGYAYMHGTPDGNLWSDGLNAGDASISHEIHGPALFYDTAAEKAFRRVDLSLRTWTGLGNLSFSYETPRNPRSAAVALSAPGGTGGQWDVGKWDQATWDTVGQEVHFSIGLETMGRWCRPIITHNTLNQRFGFSALTLQAVPFAAWPEVK